MKINTIHIILFAAFLVGVGFFMGRVYHPGKLSHSQIPADTIEFTDLLFMDRIEHELGNPVPVFVDSLVYKTDIRWKVMHIDTAAILKDYFSRRVYNDTLVNDTLLFAALIDTVSQNRLHKRTFSYKVKKPFVTNTSKIYPEQVKSKWFVGLSASAYGDDPIPGPNLFYKSKSDHLFGVQYSIHNQQIFFHYSFNIK